MASKFMQYSDTFVEKDLNLFADRQYLVPGVVLSLTLCYSNHEYTVHHLAIIKVGLKVIHLNIHLLKTVGVAPSTLAFRKEQLCAAE
jgi:hypothetical protein